MLYEVITAAVEGAYDLVVANIIHDVLVMMQNDLVRLVGTGGQMVLSGLLQGEQVDNIVKVFTAGGDVITSYSIHYTKLYECPEQS